MKREDMKAAATFRADCGRCGKRSPRYATATTTDFWMQKHEQAHRDEDPLVAYLRGDNEGGQANG